VTCLDCEVLRLRAEVAESRLASVSGVTREALVRRGQARFASAGEALRRIVELCETDRRRSSMSNTTTTCSRNGCGKKLRSNNTKGVCGSGCLSPEAPSYMRAGVAVKSPRVSKAPKADAADVMARFRAVATGLGKSPDVILQDAAQAWLLALEELLDGADE
jgi:hypothetical protein